MGLFRKKRDPDEEWAEKIAPPYPVPDGHPNPPLYESMLWPLYRATTHAGASLIHIYLRNENSPVHRPEAVDTEATILRLVSRARIVLVILMGYERITEPHAHVAQQELLDYALSDLWIERADAEQAQVLLRMIQGKGPTSNDRSAYVMQFAQWIVTPLDMGKEVGDVRGYGLSEEAEDAIRERFAETRAALVQDLGPEVADAITRLQGSPNEVMLGIWLANMVAITEDGMHEFAALAPRDRR